nr:MAG TPA: hypothetical protein [Caudoviricetes sp.]
MRKVVIFMNIFNYLLVCFREYLREHSRGYVTIHGTDKKSYLYMRPSKELLKKLAKKKQNTAN